jgi:hypothetical protein
MALFDGALASYEEPGVGHHLAEIWRMRRGCLLALDRMRLGKHL